MWWSALAENLDRLADRVPLAGIRAITVDGTSSTLLGCSASGRPLAPALMYNDARALTAAQQVARVAPPDCAAHGPSASLAKLLWLLQSPAGRQTRHFLHQADWLLGRLSGHYGQTDENNALKLGYDVINRCWPEWLAQLDIPPAVLPVVTPAGTPIGRLAPAWCNRWGMSADTRHCQRHHRQYGRFPRHRCRSGYRCHHPRQHPGGENRLRTAGVCARVRHLQSPPGRHSGWLAAPPIRAARCWHSISAPQRSNSYPGRSGPGNPPAWITTRWWRRENASRSMIRHWRRAWTRDRTRTSFFCKASSKVSRKSNGAVTGASPSWARPGLNGSSPRAAARSTAPGVQSAPTAWGCRWTVAAHQEAAYGAALLARQGYTRYKTRYMKDSFSGAHYLIEGLRLIRAPGLRRYVVIPLLISTFVFTAALLVLNHWLDILIKLLVAYLPSWLDWLRYLVWPVFGLAGVLIVFYTFSILTNLIAAPFNGLLAEAVEKHLTGQPVATDGWKTVVRDIIPSLLSELRKLLYFLLRAIPLGLLFLIPGINIAAPFIWALFSAWMLVIEYMDYPMANHLLHFSGTTQDPAPAPPAGLWLRRQLPADDPDTGHQLPRHAGIGCRCDCAVGRGIAGGRIIATEQRCRTQ